MKIEWKKDDKALYLPKSEPVYVKIPPFNFFVIGGRGNPNGQDFSDRVGILYSLAYGVKMSPKAGIAPPGYAEYTVFPLEGVWDISEEAKTDFRGKLDKDSLVYRIMIRQPDFVDAGLASLVLERAKKKNPSPLYDEVSFERIEEGACVQMMHIGGYDDEPASFAAMERFAEASGLTRRSLLHREIYISDPRKVAPEKRRTVLRFQAAPEAG